MGIVTKFMPLGGSIQYYRFSISLSSVIENVTVTINGENKSSDFFKSGTEISWRVSASGYRAQYGTLVITEDTNISVLLESAEEQIFTINIIPNNAKVIINDVEQESVTLKTGSNVSWSASCTGYETQSGELILNEDTFLNISLVKEKYTFMIIATPEDCEIYINNILQSSIIAEYLDTVYYKVSKYGYKTQSGEEVIMSSNVFNVDLEEVPFYSFEIFALPSGSVIEINGENKNYVSVPENFEVNWLVSKEGYVTQSGNLEVTDNMALEVILEKKKYTFTVVPAPAEAEVKILDVVQNSVTVDYETELHYTVSLPGYKTVTNTLTITDNTTKYINLEKDSFTYTINPLPADAIVIIDGIEQKSITKEFGSVVTWSVSRIGYISQSGTHTIGSENETKDISLVKQKYTLTIKSNYDDAIITLNGIIQNSITVDYGTVVNWSVVKNGYVPQSGSEAVNDNTTLTIILQKAFYTLTINPTPADAKILINNIEQKFISVEFESIVDVVVSHDGYNTYTENITVLSDKTLNVALVPKQYSFTINTTPANAVVKMNNQQVRTLKVNYGTTINWSVSCTGYVSQSGAYTVTGDYTKDVLLSVQYCTYTINPTPSTATVTINNVVRKSISVAYGTKISWSVANQYYVTQSGSFTITANKTDNITLAENKVKVSTSGCSTSGSPCYKYNSQTSYSVSWVIGQYNTSTSGISTRISNYDGIVIGPARVIMSYSNGGYSNSKWKKYLSWYTNKRQDSVPGTTCTLDLESGEKLTTYGMAYSGDYITISAYSSASCSFTIYKYV